MDQETADAEIFLIKPPHRDFVLGKSKKLNRSGAFGIGCISLFISIFVLLGVVFLAFTVRETIEWYTISQRGVVSNAQYIHRRISKSDDSDTHYVSFQYTHNESEYSREQQVDQAIYNRAEIGATVQIEYVPTNPQMAIIVGTNSFPLVPMLFVLVWNGTVYLVIFLVLRHYRRRVFLERNGKMIAGEILEATITADIDGDLTVSVEYVFSVPDSDKRLSKTERATRNDLRKQKLPPPGTPVVILYYNERKFMLL